MFAYDLRVPSCAPERARDFDGQQRAAVVAVWLASGRVMTASEIARRLGMSQNGAWCMMEDLAGVLPIIKGEDKRWRWVGTDGE